MDQSKLPSGVVMLVEHVFKNEEVKVTDWDYDRIFVTSEKGDYFIRTWDITDKYVDWTLFKETGNSADRIKDGMFTIPKL
ncbi:hypothetical protein CPT_Moonbeam66 [Bacillus phage Moonbeam]|uniref:Uncharacterized protein n=1 Tax=Bacillus phage Moonbeam TaxID=1540091 RepID=A0A0A0RPC3_9CAUD|nr:hypothetical protein CPT_Moonbeam66 [Bacillus phage Moonbeam]AIW03464.1 hypothetical protein CPT_Moonbeam66 [Bacillus phage Moonbeam]